MTVANQINPSDIGIIKNIAKISAIIFDVDDTLYDVGTGFTSHRNTDGATSFMVDVLHFPSKEEAQLLRNEYFLKYHSTAKGLTVAEADGKFPPLPEGVSLLSGRSKRFFPEDLDEYWAKNLNFSLLGGPDPDCIQLFEELSSDTYGQLKIIGFSNGPRNYIIRVLREIGLYSYFQRENLFTVNDVLPYCKPVDEAFHLVLKKVGVTPEECIMVEDSMKNIRVAKSLGMRTILVVGKGRKNQSINNAVMRKVDTTEGINVTDSPDETDAAVDAVVEVASEVKDILAEWFL